jgi:uncharacterized protein
MVHGCNSSSLARQETMRKLRLLLGTIAVTILSAMGCVPIWSIQLPTSDQLVKQITHLVMYPDVSCETLKTSFGVEYLPSAENPGDIDLVYEEYFVPTSDGEILNVWRLPAELNRGTVVVVQGSTGTMPCYLFVGRLLVYKGWTVIMFDYRGFGQSSGEPDMGKMHVDLNAVLDWTIKNTDRPVVTLVAVSLGSLPAVTVAVQRPENVNGIVLDSPVAMGEEIRRFEFRYGDQTQALIDMLPWEMLPEESVANVDRPLLIFESSLDSITPPTSVDLFYERAGGSKELIIFPYLGHASAPYHGTSSYSYYLERFLAKLWGQYVPFGIEDGGDPNNAL